MFIQRWRFIGLVILFFLVGAVKGTVYESVASSTGNKRRARLPEMVAKLDLSEKQKTRLDKVLAEGRECMVGLNKQYRSDFGQVRDTMRSQIKAILTVEQRTEFEQMLAEQARRREAHRAKRHPNRAE